MTHKQAMQKIRSMMKDCRRGILEECEHLLRSGAIDLESAENNFYIPKIVLTAAMRSEAFQWGPLDWDKAGWKLVKQLERT